MKLKKIAKKSLSMLLATVLMVSGLAINNGTVLRANAEEGTGLSVTAYATKAQLMNSDNFALHDDYGGVPQKVYFGKNGDSQQTWYIAGSDAADSIVLLCDPELPMAKAEFEDDNSNNKVYNAEWNCTYGTAPSEVYPNHYGASDLRLITLKGLETSAFTTSEQNMMQSTTIHTWDDRNSRTYSTTDKLYAAYGDFGAHYITVGANSAERLNEGIKVSLTSTPYNYNSVRIFRLRAPGYSDSDYALIALLGSCVCDGSLYGGGLVVPAFRLNLSSVLFASAASAASSDSVKYGDIAEGTAMTLRLDGGSKGIGNLIYNPGKKLLVATKDDGATGNISLVVQGNDGAKGWYYSKTITGTQSIKASEIKSALGLSSEVDLNSCKFWMETTMDGVTYAKTNYSTATSVSMVALSGIDAPVAQSTLDTQASTQTAHLASATPAIKWTVNDTQVTGNADYDTAYTANITLDTVDTAFFDTNVTATVNGQSATVTQNADGTITVSYTFPATAKGIVSSYTANDYTGTYDGQAHGIEVTVSDPAGVSVSYSTDGMNYSADAPTYTNAGEYTVHYKLEKAKYETVTGSKTVKINKSPLTITASDQTITYGNSIDESAYTVTGLVAGDSIENITLTPSTTDATDSGSISVSAAKVVNAQGVDVTANYDITYIPGNLIVENAAMTSTAAGYEGIYDGQLHGISVEVTSPSDAAITYSTDGSNYSTTAPTFTDVGEYTVYYKLEKANYETITDSKIVKINKRPLTITASDQTITYGDSIDESAYTITGLAAWDSTDNITLTPSTTDATDNGSIAVSTAKVVNAGGVDVTANYDITCTNGELIIGNAVIPNTAVGYEGVYDGQAHGITVSANDLTISGNDLIPNIDPSAPGALEGVTITYSEDGSTYSPTNPTYTNVGEYTVYYQLAKANYTTVTGSKTVKITKRALNLIAADQNIIYGNDINENGYTVTGLADGDSIQTVTLSPSTSDVTDSGSITVSAVKVVNTTGAEVTANYDITTTAGSLVINRAAIISTATGFEGVYDEQPHGITVDVTAPADVTITYSTDGITYSSTAPSYTSVGEYNVYYKIEKPNYETVTGSRTVKITAVPQVIYTILDGLNLQWIMNSDDTITIRGDGEFSDFVGIKIDGVLVDSTHYTAREGSTIVTLSNAYLRTLGEGSHTFEMLWNNGTASTAFTVVNAGTGNGTTPNNPNPTPDNSQTTPGTLAPDNTQTTPGNPAPDNSASDNSQTATNNADSGNAGSASDELDDVPKTGDTTTPTGLLVIMLVAGMGMLVTAMKRRKGTK